MCLNLSQIQGADGIIRKSGAHLRKGAAGALDRPPAAPNQIFYVHLKIESIYSKSNVLECSRAVNKTVIWSYKTVSGIFSQL